MLVSRKNNFVFVHNPKCGGSSVRELLKDFCEEPDKYWHQGYCEPLDRVLDMAHLDLSERQSMGIDSTTTHKGMFFFMFVRDPLTRFFSALAEHKRQHLRSGIDTPESVLHFMDTELTQGSVYSDWKYVHFKPQHSFHDPNITLYFYENLDLVWENLSFKLTSVRLPIKKLRASRDEDVNRDLAKTLIANKDFRSIFARIYRRDLVWLSVLYRNSVYSDPSIWDLRPKSHSEIIDCIHTPNMFHLCNPLDMTNGERLAYEKRLRGLHGC